jgi:decay accelerating factor
VTYKCNEGFVKVPNKTNTVICLSSNQWSELEEFCNRSCDVPPGLLFASLRKTYTQQNYFPVGSTVDYECRPGYRRDPSLSGTLTCLQNLEWSKPDEFCKKKSCPNPGEIKNGIINITTDILFGSAISFSCNTGYKLVGADSSYCFLMGKTVGWSEPLPTCVEIFCPEPPQIENGRIREESDTYKYRQTVTYECSKGLTLVGSSSIFCDVKGEQGEWSGSPPECKGKSPATKPPPTVQKPTTVKVPGTKVPPTPQKPTMVKVPGTQVLTTPQKPTTVYISTTEVPPTSQNPTKVNGPATSISPTLQKPTTVNISDTEVPLTPQKPTIINVPATKVLPTSQKPTTVNISTTSIPTTSQKPTTVNISTTSIPTTAQKPTTVNISTTSIPTTPQNPTKINVSTMEVSPTLQKPITANSSATKTPVTVQTSPISNLLSTKTLPATQNPIMTNASTQTISTTQRITTAKASLKQSLPSTQKSTTLHVSMTKHLQITQRLTSAHITATQHTPVSRTSVGIHVTRTSNKGKENAAKDAANFLYGHTWVTLTVLFVTLVVIG